MVRRTDTPERWLRCGLWRASWLSSATTSAMNSGTSTAGARPAGRAVAPAGQVGLELGDAELGGGVRRVVGADLGAEAVLQRGDDPAAVGVVLGVGRGHQHDVERQAHPVAADLDVALLQHVEQADLDPLGQVGQLVDGEDAAVEPGHEAVVDGQLVGQVPALGHPDGVDLADEVGDGGVGGGELLAVAVAAVHPGDRQVLARLGEQVLGEPGDRVERVVVDLGVGDDRAATRRAGRPSSG